MTQSEHNETNELIQWLSPEGLEKHSEIKQSTQAKYRMENKIPFYKIGKFIRYNKAEIDQWIASHKMGANNG
ncbi:hypothetical protein SJPD1_2292 [Sulfurospirillum diekertiae]|uniref:Helix-turn-helix domain-containing protein n=1 Tax=Sulfurospirillum diekertiae TaxID=1854492 RepID=A0A290HRR3_9BACT|nr:helix-turn-helix domain-containing protein [Sulfurospirillum diekertiae]ATB70388.1 hypothetical protein SJPD1_2292 [Sulfurospirillum diekertiae]